MQKLAIKLTLVIVAVGAMILLALTCPDKEAHKEAMKTTINKAFEGKMAESFTKDESSNSIFQGITMLGSMLVNNIADSMLDTKMEVKNYVFFSIGTINHEGESHTISFGILNNVYTCSEEDLKPFIDKL